MLFPSLLNVAPDLLTLAKGDGSANGYVIAGIALAGWCIARSASKCTESHRQRLAATDRKRCGQCQTVQPGFAAYCRHCGSRF